MSPMRRGTWFCAFAGGRCWFFYIYSHIGSVISTDIVKVMLCSTPHCLQSNCSWWEKVKHWNVANGSRVNPGERLGAIGIEEVRRHPWFDSLNWPGRANPSYWFWKWWTWIRLHAYFNFPSGQAKLCACNDVECNINCGINCCSLRFKKATFDSTFYSGHKVSNNLSSDLTFSLWRGVRSDAQLSCTETRFQKCC